MPVLKYYYDLLSQPSRALYMFLKLTRIPFEAVPVKLREGEHRSDEFKEQLNRFQKVPFIHHGDFKLAESTAILGYLSREFGHLIDDHWYPKNSQARAKVDEYLAWQHLNTRMKCALYFWHKWLIPLMTQSEPDERKVAALKSEMKGLQGYAFKSSSGLTFPSVYILGNLVYVEKHIQHFSCPQCMGMFIVMIQAKFKCNTVGNWDHNTYSESDFLGVRYFNKIPDEVFLKCCSIFSRIE